MINRFRYSPSSLRIYSANCPRALDFYQAREALRDENPFAVGTATHFILEHVGRACTKAGRELKEEEVARVANEIASLLIEKGRPGDNVPLSPDDVFEGRKIALEWMRDNPPQPTDTVEPGQAFTKDWKPCAWDDPKARFRLVMDSLSQYQDGDEEGLFEVLHIRDYKTAWSTSEEELDTVQMKAQAFAGMVHAKAMKARGEEVDIVRVEIVNLRTRKRFPRDHWVGEGEELDDYRRDIEATMDAADAQARAGDRPARVGANCCGCPFVLQCPTAKAYFEQKGIPETREERARKFAIADAIRSELADICKEDFEQGGAIEIDGMVLAKHPTQKRIITVEDTKNAFNTYSPDGSNVNGFFAAMGGLGATQADKLAKQMYPDDKEAQKRFLEMIVRTETESRFQFKRADKLYPHPTRAGRTARRI